MNDFWTGAEVISAYTRAQAIEDGALVDVSTTAQEAGFRWPVALTAAVQAEAVAWDGENGEYQDERGRLWDVVFMAGIAVRRNRGRHAAETSRLPYAIYRVPNVPDATESTELQLVIAVSGGDDGEPVMTIMLPHED
ncbi:MULTISPECIES: DUF6573 family protein [Paenarthrobacter]|uniref:Uncharacterized protein n=1 Tax=Paenarthrobacter ureafaciens TaxID=37931 RepID=A0AAX3EQG3_PAEUR|nr:MULTISPECIES: DUF6573 family protein [Paenarthrobacter]MDO5867065.1 hypothetical protein [Paenarthrobacter sp. SD-2]MDO5878233.1 hypothetical protein [Paenarthrobacter sp. SD-1]UYV95555.1 hypothetical protein NL395_23050 [Paenarthrobacter ureafaciens]UYW00155.1 hypothetical protein NL394_23435 [Paenarthrobacter ureafaciens]